MFLMSCFPLRNGRLIKHRTNVRNDFETKGSLRQSQYVKFRSWWDKKARKFTHRLYESLCSESKDGTIRFSLGLVCLFSFFLSFILCTYLLLIHKSNSFSFSCKRRQNNIFYNQGKWEIEEELEKTVYNSNKIIWFRGTSAINNFENALLDFTETKKKTNGVSMLLWECRFSKY